MEIDAIRRILASGVFTPFIGEEEDTHLEVKRESHDLTTAPSRFELAKDVAALANSAGGYLIIGLATTRRPDQPIDEISALALVPRASFSETQYLGIINTHVYPEIVGLVAEFRIAAGITDGLGVIFVPPQNGDHKPFLVLKVVDDGLSLKQIFVGYAERVGGANLPFSAERLQQTFKRGQDGQSRRLSRVEEKLDELLGRRTSDAQRPIESPRDEPNAQPDVDNALLEQRIRASVEDAE